ncbi:MAG: PAS domain S-box protein [Betaproteobacteria bacterium]|nr:MAG: PAS domain S-box protein [Betaproteobacteria bacterium]
MNSSESFFSRMVAALDSPLCVADRSGQIRAANAAFALLAGHSVAALQGMSLRALLSAADASALLAQIERPEPDPRETTTPFGAVEATRQPVRWRVLGAPEPDSDSVLISAAAAAPDQAARTQRALLELTAILDNASAGIVFTRDRVIQRCNQRVADIFGYATPEQLTGQPTIRLLPDADSFNRLSVEATPLLSAGRFFHIDWLLRRADGSDVWCNVYGKAVDPADTEAGTVWIIEDISEAKQTAENLRQTSRLMSAIMENAPVGIVLTKDRRITGYNAKFREMFGFRDDSGVEQPGRVLYRTDDEYAAVGAVAAPLLSTGRPFHTELFMRRQDGSDFWASLIGYVQDQDHPRDGTIWILEDHSERKIAEEALKQARDELTAIFDNASVGILFTRNRVFQHCNRGAAEIFGYRSPEELVGRPGSVIYPDAQSYERIGREAGPLLAAGKSFHAEWLYKKADGTPVWCRLYGKAVDPSKTDQGTVWIVEDITDAKQTEEALHHTLREMEAIMRNAPVGIIFTRERHIVRYNPKLAELFGFDGEQAVGLPARVLYRSDDEYQSLGKIAAPLLSQGKPFQMELFMRHQDGSDFWVNLIGYVQNKDDPAEGTIWICEDRSAFKQAQERVERANAELVVARDRAEVANRAKSDFLAKMSHELRTPLNAVLGYAQILQREKTLSDRAALGLATIEQSGQHLLTLINDILDLSRIEAGKLELDPGVVVLPSFLGVVADIVRVKAEQKDLLFDFDAPADLPRAVRVDDKRLRQVLLNLLSNAVKFTDRGMVALNVRALPQVSGLTRLRFEIRDTGIGIAAEHAPRLFQPFEQVSEQSRRSGGTGLGLAISRELVRSMGSDITVDSTPGVGSAFAFELMLPVVETAAVSTSRSRVVTGYEGPRKKVLVADDIAENRALVVDFLRMLDFATAEAANGVAALIEARAFVPDLILMDNVMPLMGGVEATRRLREDRDFDAVPIIAVSASASQTDRERSLAAGVNAFLHKPVDFDELLKAMQSLLRVTWTYRDVAARADGAAVKGYLGSGA